jgi:hypothetical protein
VNYWFGLGLLFTTIGVYFFLVARAVRGRIKEPLDGSAGAGVVLGYIFPVVGAVFMIVGLIEMIG